MAKKKKSIDLHFVTPMIYERDKKLGWVTKINLIYSDTVELIVSNGQVFFPFVRSCHEEMFAAVVETEEEIRAMVDGELKLVEFKEERKYGKD